MKMYKKIVLAAISVFAVSSVALAGSYTVNGTSYASMSADNTTTPDGNTMSNYTNNAIWILEGMPEGFPSSLVGSCKGVSLTSPEWANLGDVFICTAIDADGDGFVNVGSDTSADWTGCSYERVSAWGKYAGTTESGACWFAGSVDADHFILQWTATFTTPE